MQIKCNIITDEVNKLAHSIGISSNRAVNLITQWQCVTGQEGIYPKAEQLSQFIEQNKQDQKRIELAFPNFEEVPNLDVPIKTNDRGVVQIRPFSADATIDDFLDMFKESTEIDSLKEHIKTVKEAKAFMLYREMAFNQNGLSKTRENASKADKLALKKLIELKQENNKINNNTVVDISSATSVEYTPPGQNKKTVYVIGSKIYNSKGEEIYKENSTHRNKIFCYKAFKEGNAVKVKHKNADYYVNSKGDIISRTTGKIMQWGEEDGNIRAILNLAQNKFNLKEGIEPVTLDTAQNNPLKFSWARTSNNNYEVSTAGDRRFSALVAYFENVSIVDGVDVSYQTIEDVYQTVIKKSRKGLPPSKNSKLYNENLKTKEEREEFSYKEGYLPLWQKWAEQNPELIEELREKAKGKVLTDKFANTRVSQARALADILNQPTKPVNSSEQSTGITSKDTALKNLEKELEKIINVGRSGYISVSEKDDILTLSTYSSGDDISWTYLYRLDDSGNLLTYSNWTSDIPKDINTVEWKITTNENTTKQKELILQYLKQNKKTTTSTENLQITPTIGKWTKKEELVIVSTKDTAAKAKEIGGIDTLRHPDENGMHFGNPFSYTNYRGVQKVVSSVKESAILYEKWLRGEAYQEIEPERRQWIVEQIRNGSLKGKPLVYYTEKIPDNSYGTDTYNAQTAPNHAHILQKLINDENFAYSLVENANKELLEVLGNDNNAQNEIKDVVKTVKKGISFDEALKGVESIFTKEEIEQIKQGLNGKRLQVLSVSRQTDPAFFSKEIIKFLEENSKKSLSDPTRTNVIEIWSKHDGVPIQDILKACKKYKVAPMVSFSITGLGDTALEKGVLKYQDLIPLIGQLIESGDLNPQTTTIRIDPILVGETNMDDIKKIVQSCKDLGIKKFVTSLVQSYGYLDGTAKDRKVTSGINNALASEGRSYDWDKYYGKDSRGKINFKPKQQYINEIGKELLELNKDPEIEIETCAFLITGLKASACLDPLIIERITGISVTRPDGTYDKDTSRPDCMCYGAHSDMFRVNEKKCFSSCAYCYAGHSNDSNFKYYNEDGTLVDRPLTRVKPSPTSNKEQRSQITPDQFSLFSGGAPGSDTYWGQVANAYGLENIKHYRPEDLTEENRNKATEEIIQANKFLGRVFPMLPREATENRKERTQEQADYQNDLILRNALQASAADAIFAIGTIKGNPTSDGIIHKSQVEGGTAWAVQVGINQGKPVYVFDQVRNKWYKNEGTAENRRFVPIQEAPKLTNRFAGIGTRSLNSNGKQAIKDVFAETFGYVKDAYTREDDGFVDIFSDAQLEQEVITGNELQGTPNDMPRPSINSKDIIQQIEDEAYQAYQTFSPQTLQDRSNMITLFFEDVVDDLIDETLEDLQEKFENETGEEAGNLLEKINKLEDEEINKREILNIVPFNTIVERIKDKIRAEQQSSKSEYVMQEYQKVLDNFNYLMDNACRIIEDRMRIRIIPKKVKNHKGEIEYQGLVSKDPLTEQIESQEFDDDPEGKRVNGNDGWSMNIKMLHPFTGTSKIVNDIISKIPQEGDNARDDLGWVKYRDKGLTHTILLNNLSSMVNVDDWYNPNGKTLQQKFPALAQMSIKYPWASTIMNRLNGDDQAISAFFSDFYTPFIKQGKVKDGKLITINDSAVVDSLIDTVTTLYDTRNQVNGENTIWDKTGKYRKDAITRIQNNISKLNIDAPIEDSQERSDKTAIIYDIFKSIGITTDKRAINRMLSRPESYQYIISALSEVSTITDGILKSIDSDKEIHITNEYKKAYSEIAELIGDISALNYRVTFRESGKDYPNYAAPSEIDIMMKELTNPKEASRLKYIQDNFQDYGFMYDPETGKYRNKILQDIIESPKVRNALEIITVRHVTDRLTNQTVEYADWKDTHVRDVQLSSYFTKDDGSKGRQFSYFPFPIFSDSEAMVVIKLPSYRAIKSKNPNKSKSIQQVMLPLFREVVKQELTRIKHVQDRRAKSNNPKIVNYDKNGDRFFFLPQLNDYVINSSDQNINGKTLLEAIQHVKQDTYNSTQIDQLIDTVVSDIMSIEVSEYASKFGDSLVETIRSHVYNRKGEQSAAAVSEEFAGEKGEKVAMEYLEEFFWNYTYAQSQIVQLATTDLAFYKNDNGVDYQKRFKQLFASGKRLNTKSTNGREMSYNIVISDKIIVSNVYNDVKKALTKAVNDKWMSKDYFDMIMNGLTEINTADGQGIRSLSAFKSMLEMQGHLTPAVKNALDNMESGNTTKQDFYTVLQIIKPFAYGSILQEDGLGGKMRVGHQFKNSEMPLLAGLAVVAQGVLGKSSFLSAINDFMETHQIDTVQFESCVKTGGQGIIDIHFSNDKLHAWMTKNPEQWEQIRKAYTGSSQDSRDVWEGGNLKLLENGTISQEEFNKRQHSMEPGKQEIIDTLTSCIIADNYDPNIDRNDPAYASRFKPGTVIQMPYRNYMIAQPTPEHLFDTFAKIGSQISNFITADLPDDFQIKIGGHTFNKENIKRLYDAIHVENRLESYLEVAQQFESVESLSQLLLNKVEGNSQYGRQFTDALKLVDDPNNPGEKIFNVGFDFPSMKDKIAELLLSIFKKKVTVQEIQGGNAILTSSFAFTDKLRAQFDEDGGIKCAQCYLPAHSRKFYEPFMNDQGIIDMKNVPVELRRMVSYRIPTEGKYSALNLEVVGFLPPTMGSAIMLPVEISFIAGEDYDVDKRFLMIPTFDMRNKYDYKKAEKDFFEQHSNYKEAVKEERRKQFTEFLEEYKKQQEQDPSLEDKLDNKEEYLKWLSSQKTSKLDQVEEVGQAWNKWFKKNKKKYITGKKAVKVQPDYSSLQDGITDDSIEAMIGSNNRRQRDNLMIDIMYGILSHPDIAPQVLSPGNYENLKRISKVGAILTNKRVQDYFIEQNNSSVENLWSDIQSKSTKELASIVQQGQELRPVIHPETFVYFHQQNMTSGKLIGNYANNTTAHTKLQDTSIAINYKYQFDINGRTISSVSDTHTKELPDGTKELISSNCSETSASSVDDVKDPNLRQLGQNPNTAKILGGMLRMGMRMEEAGLIMHIPFVKSTIDATGKLSPFSIDEAIKYYYQEETGDDSNSASGIKSWYYGIVKTNPKITTDMLVRSILGKATNMENLSIAIAISQIEATTTSLSALTMQSRQDSPNGSIAHTLEGGIRQVLSMESLMQSTWGKHYPLTNVREDFIKNGVLPMKITTENKSAVRKILLQSKMPRQQSAYTLGIELPMQLVGNLFASSHPEVLSMLKQFNSMHPLSEMQIRFFQDSFMKYMVTSNALLGASENDSLLYKREYYTKQFPKKAIDIIASIPELSSNPTLDMLYVDPSNKIQLRNSARASKTVVQQHMNNLDMLLKSNDPRVHEFAIDLLMHAFYTEGLSFGPHSYGNFFSVNFINSISEIRDFYRYINNRINGQHIKEFIQQAMFNEDFVRVMFPTLDITNIKGASRDDNSRIITIPKDKAVVYRADGLEFIPPIRNIQQGRGIHANFIKVVLDTQATQGDTVVYSYHDAYKFEYDSSKDTLQLIEESDKKIEELLKEEILTKIKQAEQVEQELGISISPRDVADMVMGKYSTEEGQQVLEKNGGNKLC